MIALLFWHRIASGHYVAGRFSIRHESPTRWRIYESLAQVGFRPTLALAKARAERLAAESESQCATAGGAP